MKNVALITGASSGIGKELAQLHAAEGGDLIIVARRLNALEELKSELESTYQVSVVCIAADLTESEAPKVIYDKVVSAGFEVEVLINNAGFGGHGYFYDREWDREEAMIQLNITALSALTHLFVKNMVARRRGKILNVASTAAFLPGPLQAVYYATKAYVLSFSQAIAEELRAENITVTALCPGPVATEFANVGNLDGVAAFENAAAPENVAMVGYDAMMKGKLVVINDWKLKAMLYFVLPFLPRRMMLKLSRRAMEKS